MPKQDLAIDLGTTNTLIYQQGRGIVFSEPSVVAVNARTGDVLAIGRRAWDLAAEDPGRVSPMRPLIGGAIADFELAERMIHLALKGVGMGRFQKPRAVVVVPSLITDVERRAVEDAVRSAGVKAVALVEEPLAAAIGAGLPIAEPVGNLVVAVGGGTTEVAVVAMGGLVHGNAFRVGGADMDAAVQQFVRQELGVAIGDLAAERIKIEIGSAYPMAHVPSVEVQGREMVSGTPRMATITATEVREALTDVLRLVVATTRQCLAESPPELAQDVLETGLFLTGGGAMLRGLDMLMAQECEVPVHVTERPLTTVVLGASRMLDYFPDPRAAFLGIGHGV